MHIRRNLLAIAFFLMYQWAAAQQPATFIGQRSFEFKDSRRNRPLVTELWYPTTEAPVNSDKTFSPFIRQFTRRNAGLPAKKLPLILLSHGTGGGRLTLEWLAQGLVKEGYMVAAVDHWGNTYDNKIPIEFCKPWERPLDISYVLTALLNDKEAGAVIDNTQIGAIGFSLGGYTVLALGGAEINYDTLIHFYKTAGRKEIETPEMPGTARLLNDTDLLSAMHRVPSLKDTRIKAFFAISPALGAGFTAKQEFNAIDRPVYITGSAADSMAPVLSNARHYHKLIAGSGYYEFTGKTGHYAMLGESIDDLKKSDPVYFADDPSVDRKKVHEKTVQLAVQFFRKQFK